MRRKLIAVNTPELKILEHALQTKIEELQISQSQYRDLFNYSGDAIVIVQNGRFLKANLQAIKLYGLSEEALLKVPLEATTFKNDQKTVLERHSQRLDPSQQEPETSYESRIINAKGEIRWVQITAVRINWEGKLASLRTMRDITELKRLREDVVKQAQHTLLNQLSKGFGHNFRNILAGISGTIEELSHTVEERGSIEIVHGSTSAERIQEASKAVDRAVGLINTIVEIGQPSKIEKFQNLNLNVISQKIKEIASGSVSTFIEIKLDLALDLDIIQGDIAKIQNLLWQLLLNAIQAIQSNQHEKQGGSITIKTSNENIENHENLNAENYVVLRVTDSGSGISEQDYNQIFDLFHSGSLQQPGVGLNVVKIISEQHSAFIKLEQSIVGKGTTFAVYFPASRDVDKHVVAVEKIAEPLAIKTSNRTVLIVEDEVPIQSMYKTLIEIKLGLPVVLQAQDSDQAISLFKANQEKIGLVLLDLGIPGAGGNHVFNEIRKINPEIEVIVNSGYQQSSELARVDAENYHFFQKPVALKMLKTVITERLGLEE